MQQNKQKTFQDLLNVSEAIHGNYGTHTLSIIQTINATNKQRNNSEQLREFVS